MAIWDHSGLGPDKPCAVYGKVYQLFTGSDHRTFFEWIFVISTPYFMYPEPTHGLCVSWTPHLGDLWVIDVPLPAKTGLIS